MTPCEGPYYYNNMEKITLGVGFAGREIPESTKLCHKIQTFKVNIQNKSSTIAIFEIWNISPDVTLTEKKKRLTHIIPVTTRSLKLNSGHPDGWQGPLREPSITCRVPRCSLTGTWIRSCVTGTRLRVSDTVCSQSKLSVHLLRHIPVTMISL